MPPKRKKGQRGQIQSVTRDPFNAPRSLGAKPKFEAVGPNFKNVAPKPEPQPGGQGAAAAPKPPMPGRVYDSAYTVDIAGIDNYLNQSLADLSTDRSRLGFDTGYDAAGDIDTRNPYSQAMALQRHWQQSRRGTSNSFAARGQLYSGARQRNLAEDDHRYSASDSQLREYTRRGYEDSTTAEQALQAEYGAGGLARQRAASDQSRRWEDNERQWYSLYG